MKYTFPRNLNTKLNPRKHSSIIQQSFLMMGFLIYWKHFDSSKMACCDRKLSNNCSSLVNENSSSIISATLPQRSHWKSEKTIAVKCSRIFFLTTFVVCLFICLSVFVNIWILWYLWWGLSENTVHNLQNTLVPYTLHFQPNTYSLLYNSFQSCICTTKCKTLFTHL